MRHEEAMNKHTPGQASISRFLEFGFMLGGAVASVRALSRTTNKDMVSEVQTMGGNGAKSDGPAWSRWGLACWAAGALMLVTALVAKQFVGEPNWIGTLAQTGALLIGIGITVELVSRTTLNAAYRTAIGLALGAAVLLVWVNGAVGIIGSENNNANLMYGGVLLVGAIGAIIARLKPEGMARALFATALAQTLVAVIALVGRLGAPYSGPFEIIAINGAFVALFVGSAVLFAKAARGRLEREAV